MQPVTVNDTRWLSLIASSGQFIASRFGYSPGPETQVWESRDLPEHVIYFCTEGGFKVVLPEREVVMGRGSFLWLMPHVVNETQLLPDRRPFRTYYLKFRVRAEDNTPVRLADDTLHVADAWHLMSHVRDLVEELRSPQTYHGQRIRATLMLLTVAILGPASAPNRAVFTQQQRERLRRYMELHTPQKVSPNELADEMSLSITYFRRIFHRSYGMSPKHWIVQKRIQAAAMLLAGTELKSKEVAYQLGYNDRYLFSRQFKQVMGVSPRHYRNGGPKNPAFHVEDDMSSATVVRRVIHEANRQKPSIVTDRNKRSTT